MRSSVLYTIAVAAVLAGRVGRAEEDGMCAVGGCLGPTAPRSPLLHWRSDEADAHDQAGEAAVARGDLGQALNEISRAHEVSSSYERARRLGEICVRMGRTEEAASWFRKAELARVLAREKRLRTGLTAARVGGIAMIVLGGLQVAGGALEAILFGALENISIGGWGSSGGSCMFLNCPVRAFYDDPAFIIGTGVVVAVVGVAAMFAGIEVHRLSRNGIRF